MSPKCPFRLLSMKVWASAILFLLFAIVLIPLFGANPFHESVRLLDVRFWYTETDVRELFCFLDEEGRAAYTFFSLYIDMLYPIAYSLFLVLILGLLFTKSSINHILVLRLRFLPIGIAFFDYIENIIILLLLNKFPGISSVLVKFGAIVTLSKWIVFAVTFILLLFLIIFLLNSKLKGNKKIEK